MSQTNNLKLGWIVISSLLLVNIVLVLIIPQKPPSIEKIIFPTSPIDPQIRLLFSEAMNKTSVQDNFSIEPFVEGDFSWSGRTMVYTPKENLDFDQTYNLEIAGQALSERGNSFQKPWKELFKTIPLSFIFISTKAETYGKLQRYYVASEEVKTLSPDGQTIRYFDYDNTARKVVALTQDGEILVIDPNNPEIEKVKLDNKETSYIHRVKWLPFESDILISRSDLEDESKSELLLYDLEKDSFRIVEQGSTLMYEFFPTPDGRGILFIDPSGALVIKSLSDMSVELVTKDFLQHFGFSEYGGYLLYTILTPQGIFDSANSLIIQNSFGEKDVILQNAHITIDQASVSPDETKILFLHKEQIYDLILAEQSYSIAEVNLENKEINFLTEEDFPVTQPKYSPDGEMVSFINSEISSWDLRSDSLKGGVIYLYKDKMISTTLKGTDIEWVY